MDRPLDRLWTSCRPADRGPPPRRRPGPEGFGKLLMALGGDFGFVPLDRGFWAAGFRVITCSIAKGCIKLKGWPSRSESISFCNLRLTTLLTLGTGHQRQAAPSEKNPGPVLEPENRRLVVHDRNNLHKCGPRRGKNTLSNGWLLPTGSPRSERRSELGSWLRLPHSQTSVPSSA